MEGLGWASQRQQPQSSEQPASQPLVGDDSDPFDDASPTARPVRQSPKEARPFPASSWNESGSSQEVPPRTVDCGRAGGRIRGRRQAASSMAAMTTIPRPIKTSQTKTIRRGGNERSMQGAGGSKTSGNADGLATERPNSCRNVVCFPGAGNTPHPLLHKRLHTNRAK